MADDPSECRPPTQNVKTNVFVVSLCCCCCCCIFFPGFCLSSRFQEAPNTSIPNVPQRTYYVLCVIYIILCIMYPVDCSWLLASTTYLPVFVGDLHCSTTIVPGTKTAVQHIEYSTSSGRLFTRYYYYYYNTSFLNSTLSSLYFEVFFLISEMK